MQRFTCRLCTWVPPCRQAYASRGKTRAAPSHVVYLLAVSRTSVSRTCLVHQWCLVHWQAARQARAHRASRDETRRLTTRHETRRAGARAAQQPPALLSGGNALLTRSCRARHLSLSARHRPKENSHPEGQGSRRRERKTFVDNVRQSCLLHCTQHTYAEQEMYSLANYLRFLYHAQDCSSYDSNTKPCSLQLTGCGDALDTY